jgi:hypothetical protein
MRTVDGKPERQRLYREVNLRIHQVTASLENGEEGVELLCECGRDGCDSRFVAALGESGTLLEDGRVLLLAREHSNGYRVIAEHTTFIVIPTS